jgi:hypothetical protein
MHDAADDPAIVRPLDAPDIHSIRFRTIPIPFQKRIRIVLSAEKLMSSDPSQGETHGGLEQVLGGLSHEQ